MGYGTGVFELNTLNIAEAFAVIERVKARSKQSEKWVFFKSAKFD
jgi:hypothetical protein